MEYDGYRWNRGYNEKGGYRWNRADIDGIGDIMKRADTQVRPYGIFKF